MPDFLRGAVLCLLAAEDPLWPVWAATGSLLRAALVVGEIGGFTLTGAADRVGGAAQVAGAVAALSWIAIIVSFGGFGWQVAQILRRGDRGWWGAGGGVAAYAVAVAGTVAIVAVVLGAVRGLTDLVVRRGPWADYVATITDGTAGVAVGAGPGGFGGVTAVVYSLVGLTYFAQVIVRQVVIVALIVSIPLLAADFRAWTGSPQRMRAMRAMVVAVVIEPIITVSVVVGFSEFAPVGGLIGLIGGVAVLGIMVVGPIMLFQRLGLMGRRADGGAGTCRRFRWTRLIGRGRSEAVGTDHRSVGGRRRGAGIGARIGSRRGSPMEPATVPALAGVGRRSSGHAGPGSWGRSATDFVSPVVRDIAYQVGLADVPWRTVEDARPDDLLPVRRRKPRSEPPVSLSTNPVGTSTGDPSTTWALVTEPSIEPARVEQRSVDRPGTSSGSIGATGAAADTRQSARTAWAVSILGRPTVLALQDADGDRDVAVDVTAKLSPRMLELLVFLALHPHGVRRDAVVAALWPDTGRRRPANNLSALITRLRAAVRRPDPAGRAGTGSGSTAGATASRPGLVTADGDRYLLDPGQVTVDYWTFLDATSVTPTGDGRRMDGGPARAAEGASAVDDGVLAALRTAHELYRGPLADGLDAEWVLSVREAARRSFLDATARLVRHHVSESPAVALELLETARNLDPTNEKLYLDIMALQLRMGDNAGAANTLRLLETQLADIDETISEAAAVLARNIDLSETDQ